MDLLVRRYSKWIYAKLEMLHILICWMLLRWYSHFTSNNIGDIAHDQTWGHALDLRHSFFWTNPKNDHDVMQLSSKRKPNMTGGWIWPALQNHNLVAWFQPPDVKHSIIDPNQDWNSIKKITSYGQASLRRHPKIPQRIIMAYHLLAIRSGSVLHYWRNPTVSCCTLKFNVFAGLFWTPTHGKTWNWKTRKYEVKNI